MTYMAGQRYVRTQDVRTQNIQQIKKYGCNFNAIVGYWADLALT